MKSICIFETVCEIYDKYLKAIALEARGIYMDFLEPKITYISITLTLSFLILLYIIYILKKFLLFTNTVNMKNLGVAIVLKKSISGIDVEMLEKKDLEFTSFIYDNLDEIPIEKRDTEVKFSSDEFKQRIKKLKDYYRNIKKEIKENNIPVEVLSNSEIDYIVDEVLSDKNIQNAIVNLNDLRKQNNAELAFIGNKIGLYEYKYQNNRIIWKCYKTDHFTWKVFKELYNLDYENNYGLSPRKLFEDLMRRLEKYQKNQVYCNVLMHTLCYLFSSLGIDLLIVGPNSQNKRCCLASLRSSKIDRSKISKIHVSVDESFSDTDYTRGRYSVDDWAKRGIEEEIGVKEETLNEKENFNISYTDFSIVINNGEIGLSGIVEVENIDKMLFYPGMDKSLESDGMFLIRMPGIISVLKMWVNKKGTGVQKYVVKHCDNVMAQYPWIEFAPPIFYRTMVRTSRLPIKNRTCFLIISFITFIFTLLSIFSKYSNTGSIVLIILNGFLLFVSLVYLALWFLSIVHEYKRFSPWVPLWNGNVKILQSSGRIDRNIKNFDVSNGLYMMTDCKDNNKIQFKDLLVVEKPLCTVRKSMEDNVEKPISFYNILKDKKNTIRQGKHMRLFSLYYKDNEIFYYIIRRKNCKDKRPKVLDISFNFFDDIEHGKCYVEFDKNIHNLDIEENSLKCYFKLHDLDLSKKIFCSGLPKVLDDEYKLYDLLEYKDYYYWTSIRKGDINPNESNFSKLLISIFSRYFLLNKDVEDIKWKKSNYKTLKNHDVVSSFIYEFDKENDVIIDICHIKTNKVLNFEKKLNKLISVSLERFNGKINEMEILALQYILVRDGIFVGDIKYGIPKPISSKVRSFFVKNIKYFG